MNASDGPLRVLVTGATGYIGSRLVPHLLEQGHEVVAASRREDGTDDFPWGEQVETRAFDIEDPDLIAGAVRGVDAVVYLVHSLDTDDFVEKDRAAAERVAAACEEAGVGRIVYLSGMVPPGELSDHLRSRLEVEEVFEASAVPTTSLRAAMVIGSGSTSYELLRRLSERVPWVTPVPSFLRHSIQPIAVEDVVHLIAGALLGEPRDRHYDIGGDEVLSYPALLARFAAVAGLHRTRLLVPLVPKSVVGVACAWISGLSRSEVVSLVDSLSVDMVCREDDARGELVGADHRFVPLDEALRRSLRSGGGQGTSRDGDVQAGAATDAG